MSPTNENDLSKLFPSVATQLRNMLGNLHYAAALIAPAEAREQNPELDSRAAMLDQSYYQMLRLVNNLTAAAHLTGESEGLQWKNRDLVAVVGELCQKTEGLATLMNIHFSFSCDMDSHICATYHDSLEQVFFQLISNAFKFTPSGGSVTVELKQSGKKILLSVSDTGCGISEDLLPALFDRYLHKDLMNSPPHGLGLGLPLCRQIAAAHGGSIMAESRVGKGTKVTFFFPDRTVEDHSVSDLPFDYTGGFNAILLELADALPKEAFLLKNQD